MEYYPTRKSNELLLHATSQKLRSLNEKTPEKLHVVLMFYFQSKHNCKYTFYPGGYIDKTEVM